MRLTVALVLAASCADHGLSGPKSLAPGHASFKVLPNFPQIPAGGPSIVLAKVVGVLTSPGGESLTSEARFVGDSAVLGFEVQLAGNSSEFTLELTASDAQGVVVFRSTQKITLKPGLNDEVPVAQLVYVGPDAGVTALHVNPTNILLNSGTRTTFAVTGTGAGGQAITSIRVGWSSRDPVVATVDESGNVVAGPIQGSTWIVARTATNIADSALVKVRAPVAKVTVSPTSVTIARGQSSSFSAVLRDAGDHLIDDRTPTWSSSDPSVATVSATGGVSGVKAGSATITATAEGRSATATVTVTSPIDHIELSPTSLSLASIGQTGTVTPKLVPRAGASIEGITVSLTSSDPAVATVDSKGLVTATGNGSATITASAEGFSATAAVTVKQVVTTVTISPKAVSVSAIGESRTFTATALDATGAPVQNPTIVWTSSDPTVASVAGGVAVAKKAGSATITATVDGKSDVATFIVAPTARLLVVFTDKTPILVGEIATLSAATADAGGNIIGSVAASFTVTPPNVAQISGNKLTGLSAGVAHITATGGGFSGTLDIPVIAPFVVLPATKEVKPQGTAFFTVRGATSSVNWTVNNIVGGNSTYGFIDSEGFYEGPASIPVPATFDICAVQLSPAAKACSRVTITLIPSAGGDVIVFNDINALTDGDIELNDTRTFWRNVVAFTPVGARAAATKVMFQYGHNSQCGFDTLCSPASTPTLRSDMLGVGITSIIDDLSPSVGAIPIDVRVVFLLTPLTGFTTTEVNNLKSFAAGGGRIVYIGENQAYYANSFGIEENLLFDLGSEIEISDGSAACGTFTVTDVRAHQTTAGVTTIRYPCGSGMSLGPNDYAVAYGASSIVSGGSVPVITATKVDITPLSGSGGGAGSSAASARRSARRPVARVFAVPAVRDTTGYGPNYKRP